MGRTYTKTKRAAQESATRQRIVDATVDLHTRVGPAATTFSMVAAQAGVQRHTLYAHFPDERSLLMACSGHSFALDPPPLAEAWRALAEGRVRLLAGLGEIYAWYARNAQLLANVMRDAERHEATREITELRFGPVAAAWHEVLGARLAAPQRAMLALALSFHSWRTLRQEAQLEPRAAAKLMVQSIMGLRAK